MPHRPGYGLAARRLAARGLALPALTILTALTILPALTILTAPPAQATPATRQAAPLAAPLVIADPQPVATAPAAPRPIADPPGSESLWFVGVFQ